MDRRARSAAPAGLRVRGALALVAGAAFAFGVACSAEQGPTPGQLTIALRTNMTPGVDFDALRLVVKRGDVVLQDLPYDWPRGAGEPPMRFPATYAVVNRTSGSPSLTVRFEAKQGGRLRIVREAKTVLPTSGDFVLPVLLDWLCLDRIPASSPVDVQCRETETCIAGVCTTPDVPATTLAPYSAGAVFGGATSAGAAASSGACFDVLGTFDGATKYAPEALSGPCGVAWSGGEANLNVAVALPPSSPGFCYAGNPGGCLVPLEKGGASGWSLANGRLTVPSAVCASSGPTAGGKLAIVQGKPTKAENQPPCGSFSSVGAPDAGTAPTATIVVTDADAGVWDASFPDAGFDAASDAADSALPDSALPDSSFADGGAPDAGAAVDGCVAESDPAFCTRLGVTCGAKSGTDSCGAARTVASCGTCASGSTCSAQGVCNVTTPDATTLGTTATMTGDGLSNCGPGGNESCGASLRVTGGTFYRGTDTANPATVSDFRLDKYEVTVGRFRKFVDAWVGGWRPSVGAGKHTHLNGGAGLVNTAGGNEPGWNATWSAYVGAPGVAAVAPTGAGASTKATWDSTLSCAGGFTTWTSAAGANEKRPQNCLSWYDLNAFCIWDGGFLASEAEWEYAASGGGEERTYPWGSAAPGANAALAIYGCYYNGTGNCSGLTNVAPVGTVAAGAGRWGQLDLAGNAWEWSLDWLQPRVTPCSDCTNLAPSTVRMLLGGSFNDGVSNIPASLRYTAQPAVRSGGTGGRCARTPSGGTCTGETDAAFCTRLGATCGAKSGTDNCGAARTVASCGACASGNTCASNACVSSELSATTASMTGDGLNNCGASGTDVCARSLAVTGGTFYRGTDTANPATIAGFRLDKYEVTVGRFRKFVDAWVGGWRPSAGSGKHTHLNGGAGLANTAGGNEPGWDASWTAYVGAPGVNAVAPTSPGATTKSNWDSSLSCSTAYQTWTSMAAANEKRPQNCLSWYDLYAFCIWDGGFLPSEAEWEYAAAGGSEERPYPWGATAPAGSASLAVHDCYYNGTGTCSGVTNIAPVGAVAAGAGRWSQLDLAGNLWEWNVDWHQPAFVSSCNNCTNLTPSADRVRRGGSFNGIASNLPAAYRLLDSPAFRSNYLGGRCARVP